VGFSPPPLGNQVAPPRWGRSTLSLGQGFAFLSANA